MAFERVPNPSNIVAGLPASLPPPVDAVELLPPSRRHALLNLRQRMEDAKHALQPILERLDELRAERHLLNARLKHLKTPQGRGGPGLSDDDTQVIDAQRKLDAVDTEMSRLNTLIEPRRARSRIIAASIANIESWLREGPPGGTVLVEADIPDVRSMLKRGETVAGALDRIRHRLRELAADEHRVRSAPYPSSHAKARARVAVQQLAERGRPDVAALVEADAEIGWPTSTTRSQLVAVVGRSGDQVAGSALGEQVDVHALAAWLFRDALIEKVEAEIDLVSDDEAALSREDREQRLVVIASDKLAIERQEAALVWKMQADGLPVEHRPDADARAVLGVELRVSTEAADNRPWGEAARAGRIIEVR